jgi:hypothetical protein
VIWAAPAVWCAAGALASNLAATSADPPPLTPDEHRGSAAVYVHLHPRGVEEETWAQVVDHVGPRLPGHRPLAPPPAEARTWQDTHLLYRVDPGRHDALARRFDAAALRAAIAGARARLASPLFSIGGEEPRRDPLDLRSLAPPDPLAALAGPQVGAAGDPIVDDALLVRVATELPPRALETIVAAQLASHFAVTSGVEIGVHDPFAAPAPDRRGPAMLAATVALIALVTALALRRLRASLALVVVLAAGAPLVLVAAGALAPPAPAVALASLGAAAAVAAGASPTPLALALLPLLLLPYPAWQRWALAWPLALALLTLGVRRVLPALRRGLAARPPADRESAHLRALGPVASSALVAGLLAAGAWAVTRPPPAAADEPGFDPARVVELRSAGATPAEALAAAAADARELAALAPAATWADAPGAFVLAPDELAARAARLEALDLPGRVDLLRVALAEQGLRPDAFAEALRALDPTRRPSPEAALAGPLGPWLRGHLEVEGDGVVAVSRVALAAALPAGLVLPPRLRGPAAFAHEDRRRFPGRLALALAAGAWLAAFVAWLRARDLGHALAAALVGLATQAGVLALVAVAVAAPGPALLPALLLVGAATADAAGRPGERPALGLACLAAPGLALLTAASPELRASGLVLALGAPLGGALAAAAAPGLFVRRKEAGA